MKDVKDLTLQEINWILAKIEGYKYVSVFHHQIMVSNKKHESYDYNPCENWNRAADIVQREKLTIVKGDLVGALREFIYNTIGGTVSLEGMK